MKLVRHPEHAADIRAVSVHYEEISDRVLSAFWKELDVVLATAPGSWDGSPGLVAPSPIITFP